jgi:hypothetical protein
MDLENEKGRRVEAQNKKRFGLGKVIIKGERLTI